jgi:organic hydroperoxide reductase OsmC/OhrA
MQDLPHHYQVSAQSGTEGDVSLSTAGVPALPSSAPVEFGGPGGRWSPETLLVAAVADCFVLSFRAIARASRLPWAALQCDVDGTLARVDGKTKFTEFAIQASLQLPAGGDADKARSLLAKAEASCLITNSMTARIHLTAVVDVAD